MKGRPKELIDSRVIRLHVDGETYKQIEARQDNTGASLSEIVRRAIATYLATP